jgi:hypothetical protein
MLGGQLGNSASDGTLDPAAYDGNPIVQQSTYRYNEALLSGIKAAKNHIYLWAGT